MNSKKQVQEWEKRLVDVEKRFSDVCRDSDVNAPLITQWRSRDNNFPEIDLLEAYIEEVGFEHAVALVYLKFERTSTLHIWCRIENRIRTYEVDKTYANV